MSTTDDAKSLADALTRWVKDQGATQPTRSAPWSWVTGLVVAGVAMLAIGVMYWRAWRQGKELAKLKHERDVAKQTAARAVVLQDVEHRTAEANKLLEVVAQAEKQLSAIDARLQEVADAKTQTDENIDALKNWRDVDRYLSGNGNGSS